MSCGRCLLVSSLFLLFVGIGLVITDAYAFVQLHDQRATALTVYGSGFWSGAFILLCALLGLCGSCSSRGAAVASLIFSVFAMIVGLILCMVFSFSTLIEHEIDRGNQIMTEVVSLVVADDPQLIPRLTQAHTILFGAMAFGSLVQLVTCSKMVCNCCGPKFIVTSTTVTSEVPYVTLPELGPRQQPVYITNQYGQQMRIV